MGKGEFEVFLLLSLLLCEVTRAIYVGQCMPQCVCVDLVLSFHPCVGGTWPGSHNKCLSLPAEHLSGPQGPAFPGLQVESSALLMTTKHSTIEPCPQCQKLLMEGEGPKEPG